MTGRLSTGCAIALWSCMVCYVIHLLCWCFLEEEQKTALCSTLSEILESACSRPSTGFCLVTWAKGQGPHTSTHNNTQAQSQPQDMPVPEGSQPPPEQQPSESSEMSHSEWRCTNIFLRNHLWVCSCVLCHALMLPSMCVSMCLAALAAEDLGFEQFHSALQ